MRYKGLNTANADDARLLSDCQAGILSGHGRRYSRYLLVKFGTLSALECKQFIKQVPMLSALDQFTRAREHEAHQRKAETVFTSLSLSAEGLRKLGIGERSLPPDVSFKKGMKWASSQILNDPPVSTWNAIFQKSVDAMIVVASDASIQVEAAAGQIRSLANAITIDEIVGIEKLDGQGNNLEHFGFADGISQPLFFQRDIDRYVREHGAVIYDPSFDPLFLVLVPYGPAGGYGSYLTLRAINQDVALFSAAVRAASTTIGTSSAFVAAQVMGRDTDGSPLLLNDVGSRAGAANNFDYASDLLGNRCPFHSHIRKMNQRQKDEESPYHAIARRGVLYNELAQDEKKPGLLFACYQADIGRQFEFLQSRWANDPAFPPPQISGLDPVIGSHRNTAAQRWKRAWADSTPAIPHLMERLTDFRGGEYFFTPPISFVKSL